jgi:solute carrier family 39 (zinc transporter), member 1/2/3
MTLIIYKIFAALLIFLLSMLSVIYPLRYKTQTSHVETFELGEALASGIFLGVAFLHMLPNAIHSFQQLYPTLSYPVAETICLMGFLLLLFLERISIAFAVSSIAVIPYILALILIIHSLTEGAALGIGNSFTEASIIFLAIVAHKGSASFALCVTLMRYQLSLLRILFIITLFALMTPLGIGLGTSFIYFNQTANATIIAATFNAFAAGTFLYIAALHHIRFHQREEKAEALMEFSFLTLGLIIMAIVAFFD